MKLAIFLGIFLIGCSSVNSNINKNSSNIVEITTQGIGRTEEQAVNVALKQAVVEVSGTFLYHTNLIKNRTLYDSVTSSYSSGIVVNYKIIETKELDNLISVKVVSHIRKELLKERIEYILDSKVTASERRLEEIQNITNTQKKLAESKEFMDLILGHRIDFFDRAYHTNITKYEVTDIKSNRISGHYIVSISLNKVFWDIYFQALKVMQIKEDYRITKDVKRYLRSLPFNIPVDDPDNPLVKTNPQGFYKKNFKNMDCDYVLDNPYYIPNEISKPYTISFFFSHSQNLRSMELTNNYFRCVTTENKEEIFQRYLFDGLNYCEKNSGLRKFAIFKDSIELKVPFVYRNMAELEYDIDNKNIPWIIKSN